MSHAPDDLQLSIGELAREAGVSVRTIRYYVAEGLLPPTAESGPRAAYGQAHLDRLRAIGELKNAFLPLKEIRRQLAGMDEAEIHRLAERAAVTTRDADVMPMMAPPDERAGRGHERFSVREEPPDAAGYIANVLRESRREPAARPRPHEPTAPAETAWRRIALGDEAELLISADAYERRKDQIEALVDWARKLLS